MRRALFGMAAAVALVACGEQQPAGPETAAETGTQAQGVLALEQGEARVSGTFTLGQETVRFQSRQVEAGAFEVSVQLQGMTLFGLLDPTNGVSSLDGFASESGTDTQLLDGDRALLGGLYAALNAQLPRGDAAGATAMYLRRAVGMWSQHPSSVELPRTVMGEQNRGYTMLCGYASCGGAYTGACNSWNWYYYAKHDCQHGGWEYTRNQQIAQLGDHYSCGGDEYYYNGGWVCGEPDHWSRPYVVGNCFGRCGGGCGGDSQYTLDATNHDGCVRNGHMLASAYCDDQFTSASDDELFAPNCY